MNESTPGRCPNCGTPAPDRYCPRCGQSQEPARKSLWRWVREAVAEELALDAKLPRTFGLLLFRPGRLTSEWIAGRRARYLPPLRLLLIALLAMFAVAFSVELGSIRSDSNRAYVEGYIEAQRENPDISLPYWGPDVSAVDAPGASPQELAEEEVTRQAVTWAVLVSLPLFALALLLLHSRRRFYLVDHIVFTSHTSAFLLVILAVVLAAVSLIERYSSELSDAPIIVFGVILVGYLYLALREVYGGHRLATAARALVLASLVAVVAMGALLAGLIRSGDIGRAQRDRAGAFYRHAAELHAAGDSDALRTFAPAAIAELESIPYGIANTHDRFHLGQAQLWAGRATAARQTLEDALASEPEHPLLLGLAARAADREGRPDLATELRARFRDVRADTAFWGYRSHGSLLTELEAEAGGL